MANNTSTETNGRTIAQVTYTHPFGGSQKSLTYGINRNGRHVVHQSNPAGEDICGDTFRFNSIEEARNCWRTLDSKDSAGRVRERGAGLSQFHPQQGGQTTMSDRTVTVTRINKGDRIFYKPEWSDAGDENRVFVAMEDWEGVGNTVAVETITDLWLNPWSYVSVRMIERSEPYFVQEVKR